MAQRIGVLGGGQLGMMLFEASDSSKEELFFLDPNPACSCAQVGASVTTGDFKDEQAVLDFGADKDIITVEIEHVHVGALRKLKARGKKVYPDPDILAVIQDKGAQKQFYESNGLPTAPFRLLESGRGAVVQEEPTPFVLKSRRGGYDGQGVSVIRDEKMRAKGMEGPVVLEKLIPFHKEIAVIAARNALGETKTFPAVAMDFDPEANLVNALYSPADIPMEVEDEASRIATRLVQELELVGVLAVEFFMLGDGSLLINESAPRPHNSGHHTIEANMTSQYAQHLNAICGRSLGSTAIKQPSVMVNLLGAPGHIGKRRILGRDRLDHARGEFLHDYHKQETRPMRKMGHITVLDDSLDSALERALKLQNEVRFVAEESIS
jgi:5-(carboxyamino)imidazole ribonucleotide synthase